MGVLPLDPNKVNNMTTKDDIDNLKTEAKILAEAIEIQTDRFSKTMEQHKSTLEQDLQKLKEYNVMLQTIPKKLDSQIQELIPKIAMELDTINSKKIDDIKKHYATQTREQINLLNEAQYKINQLVEKIKRVDRRRISNFFLGIIISSGIAVGASIYGASYMIKTFPTRVVINTPENFILYNSKVSLWGLEKTRVQDEIRKKSDAKDSRKY